MSRRRQPNVEGGRTRRREVWVTPEQDAVLQQAADRDGVTVPRFLAEAGVAVARAEDAAGMVETPTQRRAQLAELFALRHTLAVTALDAKRIGEEQFLAESRRVVGRIDGLIDGIAAQGVEV